MFPYTLSPITVKEEYTTVRYPIQHSGDNCSSSQQWQVSLNAEVRQMTEHPSVVILGAGHAGGAVASQLRQGGFAGPLTLVGEEPELPYQRPPLSKAWLMGEVSTDSLSLKPYSYYESEHVTLISGMAVIAIDRISRKLTLADGQSLPYDKLILATGARARPLPGGWNERFLSLRNLRDARSLRAALIPGRRLAIIGGGYIGLEVASSARALGCRSVIIERETMILARVACPALSRFFQDWAPQFPPSSQLAVLGASQWIRARISYVTPCSWVSGPSQMTS
jgi:3-phenylpropionate/trans-cinnamate dioxygenase ferredoxin reductase subunit